MIRAMLLRETPLRHAAKFGTIHGDESRKAGVTEMRRKFFALSDGETCRSCLFVKKLGSDLER